MYKKYNLHITKVVQLIDQINKNEDNILTQIHEEQSAKDAVKEIGFEKNLCLGKPLAPAISVR